MDLCSALDTPPCKAASSYLRPGIGIALIPWLYSLILLLLHLPLAFVRIVKWEKGQWFALAMAFFSIALTIQEYTSTHLYAGQIFVWTPVALTADIGATLQLIVMIWMEHKKKGLWEGAVHWKGKAPGLMKKSLIQAFKWILRSPKKFAAGVKNLWRKLFQRRRNEGPDVNSDNQEYELALLSSEATEDLGNRDEANRDRMVGDEKRMFDDVDIVAIELGSQVVRGRAKFAPHGDLVTMDGDFKAITRIGETDIRFKGQVEGHVGGNQSTLPVAAGCEYFVFMPRRRVSFSPKQSQTGETEIIPFTLLLVFILSVLFFIFLVALQLTGVIFAGIGYHSYRGNHTLVASWCSPAFVDGSTAYLLDLNGTCQGHNISQITDRGTGCVNLLGDQPRWLKWTAIVLAVEIGFEIFDGVLMGFDCGWWNRPWATMLIGITVWSALIGVAAHRIKYLPMEGHTVVIVGEEPSCVTELYQSGLRGAVIAWTDGVFAEWNNTYFGSPAP
jgi:hypothetical protein